MDYTVERSKLMSYHSRVSVIKQRVNQINSNREKYKEAEEVYQRNKSILSELDSYIKRLSYMLTNYKSEESNYKKTRLAFLETAINAKLTRIFPYENCKIKIKFSEDRKDRVVFQLVDRLGVDRSMSMYAGGMMQSTILHSVFTAIAEVLQAYILWYDEGFAASDDSNLDRVSEEIKESIANGMQIFMVEHRRRGYSNLPRREIILKKDLTTGKIADIEHKDFE